jgi:hypothetical protein
MSVFENMTRRTAARANATVRLCAAREELWRAESRHTGARGLPAEASALHRIGEATAEVATRKEWLYWIEHGTTIRPEADGEWGRVTGAGDAKEHSSDQQAGPHVTGVLSAGHGTRRLRSVP